MCKKMRAIVVNAPRGPEVLQLMNVDRQMESNHIIGKNIVILHLVLYYSPSTKKHHRNRRSDQTIYHLHYCCFSITLDEPIIVINSTFFIGRRLKFSMTTFPHMPLYF